jgi:hypothetical protein
MRDSLSKKLILIQILGADEFDFGWHLHHAKSAPHTGPTENPDLGIYLATESRTFEPGLRGHSVG